MPTLSPQTTPYYGGRQVINPANVLPANTGSPSSAAIHNSLGTISPDNVNGTAYMLVSLSGGTATWINLGGGSGSFTSLSVSGNLNLSGAASKLLINAATPSTSSVGVTAAMSGTPGAVTVTTSACTTSSVILFSRATTGGTPGQVSITAQSAGSFTLTSTGNETSTFNYLIVN